MIRRYGALVSLLMVLSLLAAPGATAQSLAYPDEPGYEKFRRSEQETLDALQKNPSRALAFRLIIAQRRLREAQLMISKNKLQYVPRVLKDYQEVIKGIVSFLESLPLGADGSRGYFQTIEASRLRHQEILKQLARRAPSELTPSVEAALASSQQLRLLPLGSAFGEAGSAEDSDLARGSHVSRQEPEAPQERALEEGQPESPLYPAGTTRREILEPPETPKPTKPEDTLGHRLRPHEIHTRGTRRPDSSHPRPRAREPIRRGER